MKKLLITILVLIPQMVMGQQITLFDIDTSEFPKIKAKFYIFDENNKPILGYSENDFTLTENGRECEIISVTCPEPTDDKLLSLAMSIDISGSMLHDKNFSIPPVELGKTTARKLVNYLPMPPSEVALQSCHSKAFINQDFTTDKEKIIDAIDPIKAGGGNDFVEHLLNPLTGILNVAKEGVNNRVAVIYTDAWWHALPDSELQKCIDTCKKYDINFFACIYTREEAEPNGVKISLKALADATRGKMYDGLIGKGQAEEIAGDINNEINYDPCTIEWISRNNCEPDIYCELEEINEGLQQLFTYKLPLEHLAAIETEPQSITFKNIEPGIEADSIFTITAINSDIQIDNIICDNPVFKVEPASLLLPAGEPQQIKISYNPVDSTWQYVKIILEAEMCEAALYSSGYYLNARPKTKTIKLTFPNGGEAFLVNTDSIITWEGVTPEDTVSLSYSTNNGKNWNLITEEGLGLEHRWTIPDTPSDECLMKVFQPDSSGEAGAFLIQDLKEHEFLVMQAKFSPNDKYIVTVSYDGVAKVWEAGSEESIYTFEDVNYAVFSPDSKYILTASTDNTATLWDLADGSLVRIFTGHTGPVDYACFNLDGSRLVTASTDKTAILWNAFDASIIATLDGHSDPLTTVSFSPDGLYIVTTSFDNTAKIWSGISGDLLHTVNHDGVVLNAGFSSDGKKLITASYDNTAKIWDVETGSLLQNLDGHSNVVSDACFSPDGKMAATSSYDGTAIIWNIFDGSSIYILTDHTDEVTSVDFNYDGTLLVTASQDNTAIIWDAGTGEALFTLPGHNDIVNCAEFNNMGDNIVTASDDYTAKVWFVGQETVQKDVSDSLWAIVRPELASHDIYMGDVVVGSLKDSVVSAFIKNFSAFPASIDSIAITNYNGDQFSILSGQPPFVIQPGGEAAVEFRFEPLNTGLQTEQIIIYSNGNKDTLGQQISGNGLERYLVIEADLIDFGNVQVYSTKDTIVALIRYVGDDEITVHSMELLGPDKKQFEILNTVTSFILDKDNREKELQLRFKPVAIGRTSGQIGFNHDKAPEPEIAGLFGTGIGGELYIADDSAYAGEKRRLLIKSELNTEQMVQTISSVSGVLRVQKTLLAPVDPDYLVKIQNDSVYMSFSSEISALNEGTLAEIEVVAGLGTVPSSSIDFEEVKWFGSDGAEQQYESKNLSGKFRLLGVCKEGGSRLLNPDNSEAGIRGIKPNPSSGVTEIELNLIESGYTEIYCCNILGEKVKAIYQGYPDTGTQTMKIDLSDIPSGIYYIILQTPTVRKTDIMEKL